MHMHKEKLRIKRNEMNELTIVFRCPETKFACINCMAWTSRKLLNDKSFFYNSTKKRINFDSDVKTMVTFSYDIDTIKLTTISDNLISKLYFQTVIVIWKHKSLHITKPKAFCNRTNKHAHSEHIIPRFHFIKLHRIYNRFTIHTNMR